MVEARRKEQKAREEQLFIDAEKEANKLIQQENQKKEQQAIKIQEEEAAKAQIKAMNE